MKRTRLATSEDIPDLLELYRDLVADAQIGDCSSVQAVLSHPGTSIWCAYDKSQLKSMATLHVLPNVTQSGRPYALVENVVTRIKAEGEGWGRAVMEAVVTAAWEADAYKIMLLTGRDANARGFYKKLGFRADEKWGMSLRRVPVRTTRPVQNGGSVARDATDRFKRPKQSD